ncbi:hypothetical protein CRENBAI_011417 [Crenichthys baileyi]|uniref:Uncharacterized protein n=1 Tax=Crenichthys baileyi TaxID=28760 RepID=A0AAV9SKL8_9TELE
MDSFSGLDSSLSVLELELVHWAALVRVSPIEPPGKFKNRTNCSKNSTVCHFSSALVETTWLLERRPQVRSCFLRTLTIKYCLTINTYYCEWSLSFIMLHHCYLQQLNIVCL